MKEIRKNLISMGPTVCPAAVVGARTGGQRKTGGQSNSGQRHDGHRPLGGGRRSPPVTRESSIINRQSSIVNVSSKSAKRRCASARRVGMCSVGTSVGVYPLRMRRATVWRCTSSGPS